VPGCDSWPVCCTELRVPGLLGKADLSSPYMPSRAHDSEKHFAEDLAKTRLDNALALFEEFVRATARHADAATLRGLEGRFAERIQIQPSYWSQIKGRSRQIGERLARQFEQLCHKPNGWMDVPHGPVGSLGPQAGSSTRPVSTSPAPAQDTARDDASPQDDDERFIVGLVLTYYRRHPQRARTRLLDLLGEVLTAPSARPVAPADSKFAMKPGAKPTTLAPAEDPRVLWARTQAGVAPLKRKK
jgi:hypothetical protein